MLITLLTDFGSQDVYVGVMKGVIACIDPTLRVIDLTHDIPPQNLAAARFNLLNVYPYFPKGTVHIVVVDPGVGSHRRAIALQSPDGWFVGPDNGVFDGILAAYENAGDRLRAVELTNSTYWRVAQPSSTFHGRDLFAAVGAYLARGVPLHELGPAIAPESLTRLSLPAWTQSGHTLQGCVQACDRFGNVITNIPQIAVSGTDWAVSVGEHRIPARPYYGAGPAGAPLALIGSHGFVEVAINGGNAQATFGLSLGDRIVIHLPSGG